MCIVVCCSVIENACNEWAIRPVIAFDIARDYIYMQDESGAIVQLEVDSSDTYHGEGIAYPLYELSGKCKKKFIF